MTARRTLASAGVGALVVSSLVAAGCAAVLDVDKDYTLVDAGVTTDAGADAAPASGTIRCASDAPPCEAGAQECCFSASSTFACVARSETTDPCPSGTDILCDDPSDCPGASCCMTLDGQGDLLGTTCAASCANGAVTLCAPGGTCATGSCVSIAVQPSPPIQNPWFYGCK